MVRAVASMVLLALVLGPGSARADVYTWVDETGTVHFSEEPPPTGKRARKVTLPRETPPPEPKGPAPSTEGEQKPATPPAPAPRPSAARKPLPKVELFATSWCPHCQRARAYLQEKGIPFTEHDIEKETGARARLVALTGREAVPAAVIGGKLVVGFSPSAYQAALGP